MGGINRAAPARTGGRQDGAGPPRALATGPCCWVQKLTAAFRAVTCSPKTTAGFSLRLGWVLIGQNNQQIHGRRAAALLLVGH